MAGGNGCQHAGYVLVFVCKSSVRPKENKHLIMVTHQADWSTSDGML